MPKFMFVDRETLSRVTAAVVLGVAVLAGGRSFASDADVVKATIDAFHAA
jgi:hypothetical protein